MGLFTDPAAVPSSAQEVLEGLSDLSVSAESANAPLSETSGSLHQPQSRRRSPKRTKSCDSPPRSGRRSPNGRGSPHASRSPRRKGRNSPLPEASMTDHLEGIEAFCKVIKAAGSNKASEIIADQIEAKREINQAKKNKARLNCD